MALNSLTNEAFSARQILSLIDLTSLGDADSAASILSLCQKAVTRHGHVAAVCVFPQFVNLAAKALHGTPVNIATVVNFPLGLDKCGDILKQIKLSILDGANEIDLVFPLAKYLQGGRQEAISIVDESKRCCGPSIPLKVILETGAIPEAKLISQISQDAISVGADFLKTSTGKIPVGATLEAASLMLQAIRQSGAAVGFKASGGIRTIDQAEGYLLLAQQIMGPNWVSAKTCRFGASQLLDRVFHVLDLG